MLTVLISFGVGAFITLMSVFIKTVHRSRADGIGTERVFLYSLFHFPLILALTCEKFMSMITCRGFTAAERETA
jgi:hypothetical protein